jgi:hypothetical protein
MFVGRDDPMNGKVREGEDPVSRRSIEWDVMEQVPTLIRSSCSRSGAQNCGHSALKAMKTLKISDGNKYFFFIKVTDY